MNFLEEKLPLDWREKLQDHLACSSFSQLSQFVEEEYVSRKIYPKQENIFRALELTPFEQVSVVILGQDPYHGAGQAHGLSFSVKEGVSFPPSLRNILKEAQEDMGFSAPQSGDLTKWARQGVLLLNTVLTVREKEANSHAKKGWEEFTDAVIQAVNEKEMPVVFVLWGKPSQTKKKWITQTQHHVLEAPHPSPLSAYRGFFGSKPFSTVNQMLQSFGLEEIDWQLE